MTETTDAARSGGQARGVRLPTHPGVASLRPQPRGDGVTGDSGRDVHRLLCPTAAVALVLHRSRLLLAAGPAEHRPLVRHQRIGSGPVRQIFLRGMQKSMLIGVCVAVISTGIAATVGSIAGYFGGWRDRTLMWLVDLLLVVPSFILIAILTPDHQELGQRHPVDRAARRIQLDGEFPDGARTHNEPAGARIRPGRTVYGGCRAGASSPATSSRTSPRF